MRFIEIIAFYWRAFWSIWARRWRTSLRGCRYYRRRYLLFFSSPTAASGCRSLPALHPRSFLLSPPGGESGSPVGSRPPRWGSRGIRGIWSRRGWGRRSLSAFCCLSRKSISILGCGTLFFCPCASSIFCGSLGCGRQNLKIFSDLFSLRVSGIPPCGLRARRG